jgi:hypothetical protein
MADEKPDWAKDEDEKPDWAQAQPSESFFPSLGEIETGAKKGLIGGLGLPGDVSSLMARTLGGGDERFRTFPTSEEVGQKLSPIMTPPKEGEPSSKLAEFAANPVSWMGPGGWFTKLLSVLGSTAGSKIGSKLDVPGEFPYFETAGSVLGGMTPKTGGKVVTPSKEIPKNRLKMAETLKKEGVETSAGQVTGSRTLARGEQQLGGAPLAGDAYREMATRQLSQFTRAAAKKAGEDADLVTPEVVNRAFTRIGNEFDRLQGNTLFVDRDLKNAVDTAYKNFQRTTLVNTKGTYPQQIADAISRTNIGQAVPGQSYKVLRSQINAAMRRTTDASLKGVLLDYQEALDEAMEKSIAATNPADLDAWRNARREYKNMLVIEKAVSGGGPQTAEGYITPAKLAAAAEAVSKRYYRRGLDDFSDLAHAGKALLLPPSTSGTAENILAAGVPAALGTGVGLAMGGDISKVPGVLAATGVPGVTGKLLLSGPVQNWLKNQLAIEFLKKQSPASLAGIRALLASLGAQNAVGSQ